MLDSFPSKFREKIQQNDILLINMNKIRLFSSYSSNEKFKANNFVQQHFCRFDYDGLHLYFSTFSLIIDLFKHKLLFLEIRLLKLYKRVYFGLFK